MRFRRTTPSGRRHPKLPVASGSAAAGLLLVAGVVVAAPAIGSAVDGDRGQPPPGTSVPKEAQPQPDITQPAPGTSVPKKAQKQPVIVQPPNPNPDLQGAPTQLQDDEPNARHPKRPQVDKGTATSGPDLGDR